MGVWVPEIECLLLGMYFQCTPLGHYVSPHCTVCVLYRVICAGTNSAAGKTQSSPDVIQSPLKSRALSMDFKGVWISAGMMVSQAHCWNK